MRLGRIASPDGVAFVSIEGEDGREESAIAREIAEHPFGTPTFTGRQWPLADVRLLAPILASKVVAMGKNYAAHAAEMGGDPPESPVIFIKPNTSIIGPGLPIQLPPSATEVHHEGELAIVIGRPCKDVPAARAAENILGYTIGNDVSARDHQRADGQWTRPRDTTRFAHWGRGSSPTSIRRTSRFVPRSTGRSGSAAEPPCYCMMSERSWNGSPR